MIKYRSDIDGLRAIAVLSILVFHINKDWLPGGFIGVDIFFVISGFLITSIIYPDLQKNQFSLVDFYDRRIKRILPAVWFYTLLTLLICVYLYLPKDLITVAKSAFAATLFLSNVYFTRNVGYFTPQAEENPFLHTWSLAVEEQFYLVWPLLLLMLIRLSFRPNRVNMVLITLGGLSLVSATWMASIPQFEKWAFYLMPFRFGELVLGGLLATLTSPYGQSSDKKNDYLATLGILLIILGFVFINEKSLFPGISTLIPCLGTALLIASNQKNKLVNAFLSAKTLTHIGKISFSLYLAHWPVLSVIRYTSQSYHLSLLQISVSIILTFAIAEFTYRFVETPFRKMQLRFRQVFFFYVVLPSLAVLSICILIIHTSGLPQRYHLDSDAFVVNAPHVCADKVLKDCQIGSTDLGLSRTLLIGDSHAAFYISLFDELGKHQQFNLKARSVSGCVGSFTTQMIDTSIAMLRQCEQQKNYFHSQLDSVDLFLLAERWEARLFKDDGYREALTEKLSQLDALGKEVVLLAQVPKYDCDVLREHLLAGKVGFGPLCHSMGISEKVDLANDELNDIAKQFGNVSILSLQEYLCPENQCIAEKEGNILYADDDHLSLQGTQIISHHIMSSKSDSWITIINQLKARTLEGNNP